MNLDTWSTIRNNGAHEIRMELDIHLPDLLFIFNDHVVGENGNDTLLWTLFGSEKCMVVFVLYS